MLKTIIKVTEFFRLLVVRKDYGFSYQNISILCIFIFINSIPLLHDTFISLTICLLIISLSSIGFTISFWKFYSKNFNLIWAFIHNLGIGLLVLVIYLQVNSLFTSSGIEYKNHKIINLKHENSSSEKRNLTLAIDIEIEGQKKKFSLTNGESKKILGTINNWKVKVGSQKGFLGHKIIRSVKAIE